MSKIVLAATALLFMPLLCAASAHATPLISIGLQEDGGAITTVATDGGSGNATYSGAFGTYTVNDVSATGYPALPEPQLLTNSINLEAGTGSNVLNVYVTEQGLTSPTGVNPFLSSFTSNLLNGAVTSVDEQTLIDLSDGLFTGTTLASANFTSIGTSTSTNDTPSLVGPYSETTEYTITTTGIGNVNDTIDISAATTTVPEPASLWLFATGLLGMTLMRRRRFAFLRS